MKSILLFCIAIIYGLIGLAQINYPTAVEGDYIIKDFTFESKESISQLNLHYTTLGKPVKDETGRVINAVLIIHGTGSSGHQFLSEQFAGNLFNAGQLLDVTKYFIILPDGIGIGKSCKPNDGLHMKFPKYTYNDIVKADYSLLTEHLEVNHLRLVIGTSMGGMLTWVWGYTYPDFMDALMPFASLPVEIAGRNRMWRKLAINLIEMDPKWNKGEYEAEPKMGLAAAYANIMFMTGSALQLQKKAPTKEESDSLVDAMLNHFLAGAVDANDLIYQLDASRNYNPSPYLSKIKAPLFAVNSADDEINPPELKIMEKEIPNVKNGRYILLPITDKTTGHGTYSNPEVWRSYLKELFEFTNKK
jgi:homoserine O-acetyltransferase